LDLVFLDVPTKSLNTSSSAPSALSKRGSPFIPLRISPCFPLIYELKNFFEHLGGDFEIDLNCGLEHFFLG
jgi:hypothetical protein